MKHPDQIKKDFTLSWLSKADEDFHTFLFLADSGITFAQSAMFHAQQAVEKYLKAYLVWYQIEFPKTHDIAALLNLIARSNLELSQTLLKASNLTPYGVTYRYPGDYPTIGSEDINKAIELAQLVGNEVKKNLPENLRK